jgi:hypothetical protein
MRLIVCSILLLCGCSTSAVRCDAHLQPINRPAANSTPSPVIGAASGTATGAAGRAVKATNPGRAP